MAALQKAGKKRAAPSQNGPKSKKAHLESTKPDKKRSQPVTRPVPTQDSESGSDEEFDETEEPIEEDESLEEADDSMQIDTQVEQRPKDPNGTPNA